MTEILKTAELIANLEKYKENCDYYLCGLSDCSPSFVEMCHNRLNSKLKSYEAICEYYSLVTNRGKYAQLLLGDFSAISEKLNNNNGLKNRSTCVHLLKQLIELVIKEETDQLFNCRP